MKEVNIKMMIHTEKDLEKKKEIAMKIFWRDLCTHEELSEEFMIRHADELDWVAVGWNQTLSESFIEKFADKLNWDTICITQILSEEFIEKFSDKVNWATISAIDFLSEEFMARHADQLDWAALCRNKLLSEDFIRKYKDRIVWCEVSSHQKFSYEFFNEFWDKLIEYINNIAGRNPNINDAEAEKIIIECKDLIYDDPEEYNCYEIWTSISLMHHFSEHGLEILKDKLNWNYVYCKFGVDKTISEEFLLKYKDRIDFSRPKVKANLRRRKKKGFSI